MNVPKLMEQGQNSEKRQLMKIFVEGGEADPNERRIRVKIRKVPALETFNSLVSDAGTQSMFLNGCGGLLNVQWES